MLSPRTRHPTSPALRLLRATFLAPDPSPVLRAWAPRLAAGGLLREVAATPDLRRALPWLADALGRAGVLDGLPADERGLLLAAHLSAAETADRAARTLLPLGAALPPGTPVLLLKGVALHGDLYPDASLRPLSDADLYVPPAHAAALRAALGAAGLGADPLTAARWADYDASGGRAHRLSDLIARPAAGRGLAVEVKLDPVQVGVPLRHGERFLEGATPSRRYPGFLVPSPEAMAVQQAVHLARHDGSDVVWWAELAHGIARATARGAFDPARVRALVGGEGLLGTVRAAFAEADALFPGTVPAALRAAPGGGIVLPRFRRRVAAARPADERRATWGLQTAHAVGARRPFPVLASLWRRVWPGAAYVRARMGLSADAPVGWRTRVARLTRIGRGARP
ncbi:MAG: nucleotidyltransferase family protein [Planctomycetia bacterium]|nr:nucleotidyltransferase family protein [Planctomycetia bacterium]